MVSASHAARNIEITAESLQADLTRLRIQKQALERELAAVGAHLDSVQRTLSALATLMPGQDHTAPASTGAAGTAVVDSDRTAKPVRPRKDNAPSESTDADVTPKSTVRAQKPQSGKNTQHAVAADTGTDGQKKYGRLTEQIMEYFDQVGDVDVRARDVAAALGRDSDSGSINGVRSTLDRLVGMSRVQRTGRGLYRAARS